MAHEVVGRLHRGDGDAADEVFTAASLGNRLPDDLDRFADAVQRRRVRGEDNGVARLDGDLRLVKRGGGRVCARDEPCDHTDWNSDCTQPLRLVAGKLADGLHVLDVLIDAAAGKDVLDDLVLHVAKAGFLVRHLRQTTGVTHTGVGDRADDPIHLLLCHACKLALRRLSGFNQLANLLHG